MASPVSVLLNSPGGARARLVGTRSTPAAVDFPTSLETRIPPFENSTSPVEDSRPPSHSVADPCGSRSMTRTRRPRSANAEARLTVVVVLPLPPLLLDRAITRILSDRPRLARMRPSKKSSTTGATLVGVRRRNSGAVSPAFRRAGCSLAEGSCTVMTCGAALGGSDARGAAPSVETRGRGLDGGSGPGPSRDGLAWNASRMASLNASASSASIRPTGSREENRRTTARGRITSAASRARATAMSSKTRISLIPPRCYATEKSWRVNVGILRTRTVAEAQTGLQFGHMSRWRCAAAPLLACPAPIVLVN